MRRLLLGSLVLAATLAVMGAAQSAPKVHLVMYQDLECPKCAIFHQALVSTIMPEYKDRVDFEFRDYPLGNHHWARNAALIGLYLDTRDPQWGAAWRDYCFAHQTEIYPRNLLDLAAAFVQPHGITRAELEAALKNPEFAAALQRDHDAARQAHIFGTPFVLINGQALPSKAQVPDLIAALNAVLR